MATTSLRDSPLSSTPIAQPLQRAIINRIFGVDSTENLDTYFRDWYEAECETAFGQVVFQSHEELLNVISILQTDVTHAEVVGQLHRLYGKKDLLNASINLAARLWLTLAIGTLPNSLAPGNNVVWEDGKLSETVQTLWPAPQLTDLIKLPKSFNAASLETIAGIEIEWTSNLADHLRLEQDDTKVLLYHQASFLELHRVSKHSVLPGDLVEETTRTLGLLFPSGDKRSRAWFRQKQIALHLDPNACTYGPLNASARHIEHFHYWRDRLVILKQTFDDAEPHTLRLWWYDDRKKVQWYTFWIAAIILLLTIFFGLTQSVAGIVQAWAAVRSMPP